MKSNKKFDLNAIKSVQLNLLDSQVDLILNALMFYKYKNLKILKAKGIIERMGSNKNGYWKILNLKGDKKIEN